MAELGDTTDARQLVPGDPDAIAHDVTAVRTRAETMERGGQSLKQIDTGAWTGEAAGAFRYQFSYEPARWLRAADSFTTAANTLQEYAGVLRWAQRQATEAITVFHEGETATRQAKAAHEAAAEEQTADLSSHGAPPVFSDPGEAKRAAAQDMLARARNQRAEAGERAASALRGEGDVAPQQSGWEAFLDGAGATVGFVGDIGVGLWDGVTGTASFLAELSPTNLINNPDHYAELWDGITSACSFAVDHPLEFGKQMINWDQWTSQPGRALGNTAFGAIPVAGVLSKVRKFKKLEKLGEHGNGKTPGGVKPHLGDYFTHNATPNASDLEKYAHAQGWTKTQTPNGPPNVDENDVPRMTLKEGSARAAGNAHPTWSSKTATVNGSTCTATRLPGKAPETTRRSNGTDEHALRRVPEPGQLLL